MKVVFVISPDFLESILKESEKYSFEIQGYGNFKTACKRLMCVNATDLLGFVYLSKTPCKVGSEEYKSMLEFLHLCDLAEMNKKFLIMSQASLTDFSSLASKYKSIRFALLQNIEFVTDNVLNKDVFGSILLDNYEPYKFSKEKPVVLGDYSCPRLEWKGLLPPALFEVEEKVHPLEELEDTLENDVVMMKYKNNPLISKLRELVIRKTVGKEHSEALQEYYQLLEKVDRKQVGVYLAYAQIMLEGESNEN